MKIVIAAAIAAAALTIGVAPAHASPVRQADHVSCFARALPPVKTAYGSVAPIAYGYTLHCDPHPPALIAIRIKLWRFDFNKLGTYVHTSHTIFSPNYDRDTYLYASCSNTSVRYSFHTEVILDGINGNAGEHSDNSSSELMTC
ncbi:hypothetical protein [Nocardia miyunensis]|uniref:hypothetical protein n=1 Tax=Nocardia miyunensis TaxID=282684 RepID=UPI00082DEFDB|nr:hypothetical protein [Nocardia miyunensis]